MTALEVPPERLYHSDWGLLPFQVEGVVYCYERLDNISVWDTGLGKTHLGMATSAMLFEDNLIDHVLVVCERNKVAEWVADFAKFTHLKAARYYGDIKKRGAIRLSPPQVMVTTYETARNDAAHLVSVPKLKNKRLEPHLLTNGFAGKRMLVIYDEMTKLGNRGSSLHKAHDLMVTNWRKTGSCRVLGLTATPIERNPVNFYNLGRILTPKTIGTVANFEKSYVKTVDIFGNYAAFKNLSPSDMVDPDVVPFSRLLSPVMLRKRKTDADVIEQFPKVTEEFTYVDLSTQQRQFYDTVHDVFTEGREEHEIIPGLWTALRQIAAHPAALLASQGALSQGIVREVGEAGLRALGSAKSDRLVEYLLPLVQGQGAQAVVFSFFGPSVLPLLSEALTAEGIRCAMNHGQMTHGEREQQKAGFKAGLYDVFLTSDAGARGINLPEASYACVDASTPVLTDDLRWVPAGELLPGDRLLAGDEYPTGEGRTGARKWRRGEVLRNQVETRDCLRVTLTNGDSMVVTPDHLMYVETRKGVRQWRRADEVRLGWSCPRYFDVWKTEDNFEGGWMSGLFDGEGWCAPSVSRTQALGVAQNPGLVLDRLLSIMERSKFRYAHHAYPPAKIERVMILGGRAEQARFLGTYRVSRLIPKWMEYVVGKMMSAIESPQILSVEPVGPREVAVMETTTKTFIADGYFQHNCEYEMSLTHANRTQRLNRIHRIDSTNPSVTFQSFIARDTVEEPIARSVLERNRWSDLLLDDDDPGEDFLTAADRRRLLSSARKRFK